MSLIKSLIKVANYSSNVEKAEKIGNLLNDVKIKDEIDVVLKNGYTIDDYIFYIRYNFFTYNISDPGVFEWLNELKQKTNSSFLDLLQKVSVTIDFKDIEKYIDVFTKEEFSKIEISDTNFSNGTLRTGGLSLHLLNLMTHSPKAEKIKEFVLHRYPKGSDKFNTLVKFSISNGYGIFVDDFIEMAPKK